MCKNNLLCNDVESIICGIFYNKLLTMFCRHIQVYYWDKSLGKLLRGR